MKNILADKPTDQLTGRLFASVNFVSDDDIKEQEVLDIGCGYGWCELNLIARGVRMITGMEVTETDLQTISQNIEDSKLNLAVGSAIAIPFVDRSFNAVMSWEVLEHIPKNTEGKMFSEVFRVLKPEGVFYLSTPHRSFWANVLDPAWWLIGHRHYSVGHLISLAEASGFVVEECQLKGGWWEIIGQLDMYIAKWVFGRQPFYNNYVRSKQDGEYLGKGFTNVFMKLRKK